MQIGEYKANDFFPKVLFQSPTVVLYIIRDIITVALLSLRSIQFHYTAVGIRSMRIHSSMKLNIILIILLLYMTSALCDVYYWPRSFVRMKVH